MIKAMTATLHNPIATPPSHGLPQRRRWTREEYYRIADMGLFQGQRVELIDGEITEMSPQGSPHYVTIALVERALIRAFGPDYWVRTQGPLALSKKTEPEPDIAVIHGDPRTAPAHPSSALLVVEIADTSLDFDLGAKASLYASAGIADYWVVDLNARRVIVHRQPTPDAGAAFGHRYADIQTLDATGRVSPLANTTAVIAVADLLP